MPTSSIAGLAAAVDDWWILADTEILLEGVRQVPTVIGYRHEHLEKPPVHRPVAIEPDWICEVIGDTNRAEALVTKLLRYHAAGVTHYWIVDLVDRTLTVHRHLAEGYLIVLRAEAGERVRAEPFHALELSVDTLL
jgi:Uma2 family endonuclease